MSTEIKVPALPESVEDATVSKWHKKPGDKVSRDENLVDIETDKVVLEVPAPADGVLEKITKDEGETVGANDIIGMLGAGNGKAKSTEKKGTSEKEVAGEVNGSMQKRSDEEVAKAEKKVEQEDKATQAAFEKEKQSGAKAATADLSPAVRRLVSELDVDISEIKGTGKSGRVTKEDIEDYIKKQDKKGKAEPSKETKGEVSYQGERTEKRVPMTRLRKRVAERLLAATNEMAILTTFNDVNMHNVMQLRKQYKDLFEKTHDIRLGFMSFFVKAAVAALKRFPDVNAFIEGEEIIYHNFCDIGVAVSSERGLVVPVIRNAEQLTMAQIEAKIAEYGNKAKNNKLTLEEMTGGTFTISNGGVFGSLLSTPILNPPQSAILGMHKIEERPVVENGQIVIRPMMYLAMSYDHRIIDGKTSVQFLKTIKELIEDPARLLLDV